MAQIILNIPDPILPRVVSGICSKFNYTLNQLQNETQGQFSKRMLTQTVKQWVKDAEGSVPFQTASTSQIAIEQDIETNVIVS